VSTIEAPARPVQAVDLLRAVERGEIRVHYLPIVSLRDLSVVGVEALARWHREDELLEAGEFLVPALKTGAIADIGRHVMWESCAALARWNDLNPGRPLTVSVNASLHQLLAPEAADEVASVLSTSGLHPSRLCIEVREDALSDAGDVAAPILETLKGLGVRLSVDDFGTGTSSLVGLLHHRVDELKIDRSFVARMDADASASAIVRGVALLARSLEVDVVAEGVERPSQEQMLRALGCDAAQGWLYARPSPDLETAVETAERAAAASRGRGTLGQDTAWDGSTEAALADVHRSLEARVEALDMANDRLRSFASTLSHDLMQPVSALDGFLSLLDRFAVELADDHREWLAAAVRSTSRVAETISALHRAATADEVELAPVAIGPILTDVLADLAAGTDPIELAAGELPTVLADRGLLAQVLANLVQNSVRYRDERPLRIAASAVRDGSMWAVTIADNGRGIDEIELEAVFERGRRGRSSHETDGTGTGLATVRSLMGRMAGSVWAEPSELGARIVLVLQGTSAVD
jgi:EAL domain-containing protein (putative c-di-GMP-specific phosphodiesterase class I)